MEYCWELYDERREYSENVKQVSLLEQWKQAKELHLEYIPYDTFPTEYATHFKRFQIYEMHLDPDTLIWIRDYILEHENAEFCLVTDDSLDMEEIVLELDGTMGTPVSPDLRVYTVPDSKYYLEFKMESDRIAIEKKNK